MTSPQGGGMPGMPVSSDEKMMAGLAYVGDFILCIPGILIFLMKKDESEFVKFHCLQAIGLFVVGLVVGIVLMVISVILGFIPVLGWIGSGLILLAQSLIGLAMCIYLLYVMIKAFMGETIEIPMLAPFIRNNMMK